MQVEKKFSRYEIKGELGRGGMATVYRAYDPMFEREVALKILNRELLDNPQFRERFERETKIVAKLEHPAIVPVHDVGRDNDQMFYVMRYMAGGSLSDRMGKGALPLAETVSIIQSIASGLDYAHAKGVIHRDLKPGNILFDENGEAHIADFGIAKLAHAQTRLTSSGIIGTPAYMSPEQAQGDDIDGRSDIYSLGIILFEMLSGKVPYEATTPLAMVIKHLNEPVPHILDINPSLPDAVEMVLEKALAKNRNMRYATAAEMANALAETITQPIPRNSTLRHTYKVAAQKKQNKKIPVWGIAGGLVGLIVVALAVWQFTRSTALPPVDSPTPASLATNTQPALIVEPSETPVPAATATLAEPTPEMPATTIPGIGGADKVGVLTNKDIWLVDLLGTEDPLQLTNSDQNKFDLQWLPGGKEILYGEGRCVKTVNIETNENTQVTCLDGEFFEGFRVSPDGKQVAVTIERRVIIVPFDRDALEKAKNPFDLQGMENACLDYAEVSAKHALWSADGKRIAVLYQNVRGERLADTVRVINVSRCQAADPLILDEFPAKRFTPDGYEKYPVLPSYDWDGDKLFIFNTFKRNLGYGDLYLYDMSTHSFKKLNPVDKVCCYRDARFSPDGKYILLVFQDERLGAESETKLYYIPIDQVESGGDFIPINLPPLFFPDLREEIMPVLRPAGS